VAKRAALGGIAMGPTELLLDHYAEEYAARARAARASLAFALKNQDGAASLDAAEAEIRIAAQMLEQMEVEALATDAGARPAALERLRMLRKELSGLQSDARRVRRNFGVHVITVGSPKEGAPSDNGRGDDAPDSASAGAHTRLLAEYEHVQRTDACLDRVQRLMAESEGAAASVLEDMRRQSEQIERTRRTLGDTEADIDRTNRVLRTMLRRLFAGRAISVALVVCLFVCCLLVIWYKFFL
jgi:vesicle transport through interaction with t-SNAREs 1